MTKPTIIIVGASEDRQKFGNKAVRAYLRQGYDVYPVNPKGGEIEGLTAHRSLEEVPVDRPNRISFYVPPQMGVALLPAVKEKNAEEFWLNPGSESDELLEQARQMELSPIVACSIVDVGESPSSFV